MGDTFKVQYPSQTPYSEDGPKNPLKGITMKLLVLASYAQSGVGAGRNGPVGRSQWHAIQGPNGFGGFFLWARN